MNSYGIKVQLNKKRE